MRLRRPALQSILWTSLLATSLTACDDDEGSDTGDTGEHMHPAGDTSGTTSSTGSTTGTTTDSTTGPDLSGTGTDTTGEGTTTGGDEHPPGHAWYFTEIADPAQNHWGVTVVNAEGQAVHQLTIAELAQLSGPAGNGNGAGWGDAVAGSDGRRVFANAKNADHLAVFDSETMTLETLIAVGGRPVHAWNPNHGPEIWTHADATGAFHIIDQASLAHSGPITAAQEMTGHGKLLYAKELGAKYFATNTNDPGVFAIGGSGLVVGPMIELCGVPCVDDPETPDIDESEEGTCGGTHDKAYNPAANVAIFQCSGDAGGHYAFVNATTDEVIADLVPMSGSIAHSPGNEYIVAINNAAETGQLQIWDTRLPTHTPTAFDATLDLPGEGSARGTMFHQRADGNWEAWIPQTAGDQLAIVDLATRTISYVAIGVLTKPDGARHFSRRGAISKHHFYTYNDAGIVVVDIETKAVVQGPALTGAASRIAFVGPSHHEGH